MMFYPGGGYPGFYFWLGGQRVSGEVFNFVLTICRLQLLHTSISTTIHEVALATTTTRTVTIDVER